MYILKNGGPYEPQTEYAQKRIIIAIDSSKTNSCVTVANEYGLRLDDYELRGDPKDDVLDQCKWERQCLYKIFEHSIPFIVGIEDIITKKESGKTADGKSYAKYSGGIEHHMSRYKITAIFMSFIIFFQDTFDITPELVNNWLWKSNVLPEEYRTREHNKGSLDWHRDRGTKLANRTDDVTDCDCILEFLKKEHGIAGDQRISDVKEICSYNYKVALYSEAADIGGAQKYVDNEAARVEDKIAYMVNHTDSHTVACCLVDIKAFAPRQIYTWCRGKFNRKEERLYLCVRRLE